MSNLITITNPDGEEELLGLDNVNAFKKHQHSNLWTALFDDGSFLGEMSQDDLDRIERIPGFIRITVHADRRDPSVANAEFTLHVNKILRVQRLPPRTPDDIRNFRVFNQSIMPEYGQMPWIDEDTYNLIKNAGPYAQHPTFR